MKRIRLIIIAITLIASLTISCITASGFEMPSSETANDYNTIAHHYFEKLGNNIPQNEVGSCVYVSMAMLLSFYDFYWDDSFVVEKFEENIKNMETGEDYRLLYTVTSANLDRVPYLKLENNEWKTFEANDGSYSSFVNDPENKLKYIHLYLISIGTSLGFHYGDERDTDYGVKPDEQIEILDAYLDSIFGPADYYRSDGNYADNLPVEIHYIDETDEGVSRQDVIDAIKTQVVNGNPVMYGGYKLADTGDKTKTSNEDSDGDGKVGHSMIAYNWTGDLDAEFDIELHKGHIGSTKTTINTTEYDLNIDAMWIEINENILPHSCPEEEENYNFVERTTGKAVCSCQIYGEKHTEHKNEVFCVYNTSPTQHDYICICGKNIVGEHKYTTYNGLTSTSHTAICECGYSVNQTHELIYWKNSSTHHKMGCVCGYDYGLEEHSFTNTYYSAEKHKSECACGYVEYSVHDHASVSIISNSLHKSICSCGYEYTEMHFFKQTTPRYSSCVYCGYTRDEWGPGQSIITGTEDEEESE